MTNSQRSGRVLRWIVLTLGVLCFAIGVWWIFYTPGLEAVNETLGTSIPGSFGIWGTPAVFATYFSESLGDQNVWEPWFDASLYVGIFLIAQWFFLRPKRNWQVRLATTGRPMISSVIGASLMAMLLSAGLIATLMEIPETALDNESSILYVWAAMVGLWALWFVVFAVYWRTGDRYTQMSRMIRGLIAGSVLELMVATPVHAIYYDRDDCYCARGSYTGLIFGGTVLIWAFGPGIVLLFMREKIRRQRLLADEGRVPADGHAE